MKFINNAIRYFVGNIKFCAENGLSERLINLCSVNNIFLWDIKTNETGFYAKCFKKDYEKILDLSRRANVEVRKISETGFIFKLKKYKYRMGVLVGVLVFISVIWCSQMFIWSFEIEGNNFISENTIINELSNIGVKKLSFIPKIDFMQKKDELLLKLPQAAWLTMSSNGGKLIVKIKEKVNPPVINENYPCDIVASKTGVIKKIDVYNGTKLIDVNYPVKKGDIIVSGCYKTKQDYLIKVHSNAKVIAETNFEKDISIDLSQYKKEYTGKTKNRYFINFFSLKIPLFISVNVKGKYDLSESEKNIYLFGKEIPIGIKSVHYRFYNDVGENMSIEEGNKILTNAFKQYEATELKDAVILKREVLDILHNNILTKRIKYTAEEDIALKQEIDPTLPPNQKLPEKKKRQD